MYMPSVSVCVMQCIALDWVLIIDPKVSAVVCLSVRLASVDKIVTSFMHRLHQIWNIASLY